MKIYIDDVDGGLIASKIKGHFILDDNKFKFNAIAFGRIGGHNIGITLSKLTEKSIKHLGYDLDEIITVLQRQLIEGKIHLPDFNKQD